MNVRCLQMAGATGIEPVSTVLETDVLPLDQAPKLNCLFILPYQFLKSNSREFDSCLQFFTNQIAQNVDYINAFEFFYCQIRENKCTNMG